MSSTVPAVRRVEAHVFRCPIETPVRTSFGTMRNRPAVLVRVTDESGAYGWGEAWCNFPDPGAEYRAQLIAAVFAPLVQGRVVDDPRLMFDELTRRTAVLALQAGERGPFAQCVAGIDIALWDLAARRAGLPLWRHLGGTHSSVPVYASGLNPEGPEKLALARRAEGHRAFKLKVGFHAERDLENLDTLRGALGDATTLMVDANQAWEPPVALAMAKLMERYRLAWLEEPLRADRSWGEWSVLAASSRTPLAAGENIAGLQGFDAAIASGILAVIQPDLAKWGGFTGCLTVARRVIAGGIRFCPHYLGAGIGLVASAHLLAAAGGDGMLEIDSNDNALRTMLAGPVNHVVDGRVELGNAPGLGIDPDLDALEQYRVGVFAS